jgi:2-polyprenyl-6-methoxyphenol hydroxylase-like FAD-dependent oxidoreductase
MRGMSNLDVSIRGAGAVGLSLALSLARQGLRVGVVGAAPRAGDAGLAGDAGSADAGPGTPATSAIPAIPDVRAYALNAASRQLLTDLKVWDALPADAVTPVHDMHIEGDGAGAALGRLDFSAWQQGCEALAWIVDAAELETALRTAARFAPHLAWVGDAEAAGAPLTVLAEGKASASRAALGVRFERQDYGHSAIAARLQADVPHGGLARQWFRSPDVLALLPFDRPTPGHGYGLVWSLPTERATSLCAAPVAEFEAALADATGGAAGTLRLCGERATWPLALARADRLCGAGWALVGDAAHLVHPLAGQGLNLGLADVVSLARVIAEREPWRSLGDPLLLRRYARERVGATQAMALLTDGLLHLFAQPQPALRELRNRGMTLLNHAAPIKRFLTRRALGG